MLGLACLHGEQQLSSSTQAGSTHGAACITYVCARGNCVCLSLCSRQINEAARHGESVNGMLCVLLNTALGYQTWPSR
jgi:hypothetical protein